MFYFFMLFHRSATPNWTDKMSLSVIIPTYNRMETLERALSSVFEQSLPDSIKSMQVIVVDDGSSDGTNEMVADRFPQAMYLQQRNSGVSQARNVGIQAANGDWIALLDSDDQWLDDKLIKQFKLLEQSALLVCHSEEIWIRNGVRVNQMKKHQKQGGWIFEKCLPLCAMSPSSIIIHQSVLASVGLFDEALPVCEDYDLWLRITAEFEVAFEASPCINKFGGHEDQLSRQYWGMDRYRVIALDKILNTDLPPNLANAAIEMITTKLHILLNGAKKHNNTALQQECLVLLDRWKK